jgi:hypothetical protein
MRFPPTPSSLQIGTATYQFSCTVDEARVDRNAWNFTSTVPIRLQAWYLGKHKESTRVRTQDSAYGLSGTAARFVSRQALRQAGLRKERRTLSDSERYSLAITLCVKCYSRWYTLLPFYFERLIYTSICHFIVFCRREK